MNITVKGTVHAADPIKHDAAYAAATFNTTENLEISTESKSLHFRFTRPFSTNSVDTLLTSLITDHSNVSWELAIGD